MATDPKYDWHGPDPDPDKPQIPMKDVGGISLCAYDFGRADFLDGSGYDHGRFWHEWEQAAYLRGYNQEMADYAYVMPYYTQLRNL